MTEPFIFRRIVTPEIRDDRANMQAPALKNFQSIAANLTKRQGAVLTILLNHMTEDGLPTMVQLATLKTTRAFMEKLWMRGLVNDARTKDARGTGNTPESSWWWLTTHGERVCRALGTQRAEPGQSKCKAA